MWSPKNGGLILGSRNNIIYKDGVKTNQDGYGFSAFIENHSCLEFFHNSGEYDDYVLYGEFHGPGIQKGVQYAKEKDFRVFDVRNPEGNFMDWDDIVRVGEALGFKIVPVLLEGNVTVDDLDQLMDKSSQVAIDNGLGVKDNIAEGVVIKPTKATRDRFGNWLRVKYKSEKWAENASAPKARRADPNMAVVIAAAREFATSVVTLGRVATIADHITRDGNVELDMSRTGDFLRAFVRDVTKEHKEVYDDLDQKEINIYNKSVNGLAILLWKDYLMR